MKNINYEEKIKDMIGLGLILKPDLIRIRVPNAKAVLWSGIQYFCKENAQWLPEYEAVVEWLSDNKGRGLFCFGNCGRGKSLICARILPMVINHYHRLVLSIYNAQDMNQKADDALKKKLLLVDDLGTESISVKYGEKRLVFPEICDAAERHGNLLIVTTNLSLEEIREKYGERTLDRMKTITKPILFQGKSMRK